MTLFALTTTAQLNERLARILDTMDEPDIHEAIFATRTHFEIRVVKAGKKTAIDQRCETPNDAKESAEYTCRALGLSEFHELSEEQFVDAAADGIDGVYLVPCKTTTFATAIIQ